MRAIAFRDFGDAPALAELQTPDPGPGEVLVRIGAASLNGFDLGVLGGMMRGVLAYDFPVVLGKDFAGEVAALGAGVTDLRVGDAVFGVVMRATLGQEASRNTSRCGPTMAWRGFLTAWPRHTRRRSPWPAPRP